MTSARKDRVRTGKETASPAARLDGFKGAVAFVIVASAVVNVLALTGSLYMMLVYDRTLTSYSVPTLVVLSILAITLYAFQGTLEVIRSQVMVRLGARLDAKLAPLAHTVAIDLPRRGVSTTEALERGRDVDTLRTFLGGQGPIALADLPWVPIYLTFVFVLHPLLGWVVLGGAAVLAMLTWIADTATRRHALATQQAAVARMQLAETHARSAEALRAMGFANRAAERFATVNLRHVELNTRTSDAGGTLAGLSKVLRMILQSAMIGLGAYLTIKGELTAGSIIAASVTAARALAPVDLAIANWKNVVAAHRAWRRLAETLGMLDEKPRLVELPAPRQSLAVEGVGVAAPATGTPIVANVTFNLDAGQAVGLIGPSASGKSSLVRALVGVWPLARGRVRLDGADLTQWAPEALGRHIGYLPQDVGLLDGTIAENISRLDPAADSQRIIAAAEAAGVHGMIVRLPKGYDTEIGVTGTPLSAGQRQRIALARALYGDPFLVVLDEPNSNLDAPGEQALAQAIRNVRDRGGIVVIVAHRPSALSSVDHVGVIQDGKLTAFGPRDEVLQAHLRPQPVPPSPPPGPPGDGRPRNALQPAGVSK
ncbi:MAG: type I secretion system permease/ATPase [Hyphomicrobiaceae bacterium]